MAKKAGARAGTSNNSNSNGNGNGNGNSAASHKRNNSIPPLRPPKLAFHSASATAPTAATAPRPSMPIMAGPKRTLSMPSVPAGATADADADGTGSETQRPRQPIDPAADMDMDDANAPQGVPEAGATATTAARPSTSGTSRVAHVVADLDTIHRHVLDDMRAFVSQQNTRLAKSKAHTHHLAAEFASLEARLAQAVADRDTLVAAVHKLEEEMQDRDTKIATLAELAQHASEELAAKDDQVEQLAEQLTAAASQLQHLESDRDQAIAQAEDAEQRLRVRSAEVDVLQEDLARKADMTRDLEEEVQRLTGEHTSLVYERENLMNQVARYEERIQELAEQTKAMAELESFARNAQDEMATLTQQIESKDLELIRVSRLLEDSGVQRSGLEDQLREEQSKYKAQLESIELLHNTMDELQGKNRHLDQELETARKRIAELEAAAAAGGGGATGSAEPATRGGPSRGMLLPVAEEDDIGARNDAVMKLQKGLPFAIPKTRGPSSVMSTSEHIFSTLERLGIGSKRKAGAMSTVGDGFRIPDPAAKRRAFDSMSVSGRSEFRMPTTPAAPRLGPSTAMTTRSGAVPSVSPRLGLIPKSTVVTFSGFRESLPGFHPKLKETLSQHIIDLNGGVKHESDEFDYSITHVLTPPNSRTIKTLAAALSHKYLVFDVQWIYDSVKAGKFLPVDPKHGVRYFSTPFKGKTLCITDAFREENAARVFRMENAELLVQKYGKGTIVSDPNQADWVLTSASDKSTYKGRVVDWTAFIKIIVPDYQKEGS
ncbi:hypothetical protein GGF32_007957 [Allomyces javanicus]|nr:hypothetical protein GGF32_007957 [Allomyces javanicus]